ncbi:membrane protein YdbS with pleckstrin-like domain [Frigoribacterium sp. 2355]
MFGRRTTTTTRRPRPRAVWAALVTSVVLCVLIVVGVLLPVLTLIGAADGGTAGALDVPVGSIVAAIAIGYVLALVVLLLIVKVRNGALAWVLGVAAVISTLVVSLWPLVAVAIAGVDQVQDLIPFIQDLITRFWPGS